MYKKILFAASSPYDLSHCLKPYLEYFLSKGWEVHVLTSGDFAFKGISRLFKLPLHHRSVSWKSFQAVRKVRRILKEQDYGILHTYGSEAGFCVRMAAQNVSLKDTKVIHISDGYNFLDRPKTREEKAALFAERLCSGVTDVLMTMNETDFFLARHFRLCKDNLIKIPGLGITAQVSNLDSLHPELIRKKYRIDEEDTVFLCPGDYTVHGNQLFLIENLEPILTKFKKIKVIFCGNPGPTLNACKVATSKNRLEDFVTIVEDMDKRTELFAVTDFLLAPSFGEGMPVHVLEAFEYAVPVLASRVKGHMDLIQDGKNGFLFGPANSSELIGKIYSVLNDPPISEIFVENSQNLAEDYKLEAVKEKLLPFYHQWMEGAVSAPKMESAPMKAPCNPAASPEVDALPSAKSISLKDSLPSTSAETEEKNIPGSSETVLENSPAFEDATIIFSSLDLEESSSLDPEEYSLPKDPGNHADAFEK